MFRKYKDKYAHTVIILYGASARGILSFCQLGTRVLRESPLLSDPGVSSPEAHPVKILITFILCKKILSSSAKGTRGKARIPTVSSGRSAILPTT